MSTSNEIVDAPPVGQEVASGDVAQIYPGDGPVVEDGSPSEEDMAMWMSLRKFNIDDFLKRPILIASGQMLSTDTLLTAVANWKPTDLFLTDTNVIAKMRNFGALRGTLEVTLVVNAPTNAYGLYLLAAIPDVIAVQPFFSEPSGAGDTYVECDAQALDSPFTATQGIHGFIDISTSNTVILKLPYLGVEDARMWEDYPTGDAWRLVLWCLSPVANSVNAVVLSAGYKLYANLTDDYELTVAEVQGEKKKKGIADHAASAITKMDALKESKSVSTGSKKVAQAAAMAGAMFPAIAPMAGSVAAGAAAVASLADYFGFTRESKPDMPMNTRVVTMSNRSCVDGFDGSEINALFQTNSVSIDPTIGGGPSEDECTIGSLYARWTLIDNFQWSTNDATGTILRKIAVSPYACGNILGTTFPTVAGYIGMPFQYWRGGMEYRIIIASSAFHRGQLQLLWDATPPAGTTYPNEPTGTLYNTILEATSASAVDITIPYSLPFMCLRNTGFFDPTDTSVATYSYRECNGFLVIRALNSLQATVGNSSIRVIVLARACPDMRFGTLKETHVLRAHVSAQAEFNMSFQIQGESRSIGNGDSMEAQKVALIEGDTTEAYPSDQVLWGESFLSVRAFAQKFARIAVMGNVTAATTGNVFTFPFYYPRPLDLYNGGAGPWTASQFVQSNANAMGAQPVWTPFSHVASMFCGVRGSVRVKVLGMGSSANYALTVKPMLDYELTQGNLFQNTNWVDVSATNVTANLMRVGMSGFNQLVSVGQGVEVQLPNYAESKMWVYRWQGCQTDCTRQKQISIQTSPTISQVMRWEISYAAGPDISFIRFRRVPGIKART